MTGRSAAGGNKKFLPGFCGILGNLLFISVIAAFLPMAVPRFLGIEVYEVISESMEPEIPVGSAVYVKGTEPEMLSEGDVIAFQRGDSVITHRVMENKVQERALVTKGDANNREDTAPVSYDDVIGKVEIHMPAIGIVLAFLSGDAGKICAVFVLVWGAMLHLLAGILRSKEGKKDER